jgi:hypothetical protein
MLLLLICACTPNEELLVCRHDLRNTADAIRFSLFLNPDWSDLFVVDGVPVAQTLDRLADRLEANVAHCPCLNSCTYLDDCQKSTHPERQTPLQSQRSSQRSFFLSPE